MHDGIASQQRHVYPLPLRLSDACPYGKPRSWRTPIADVPTDGSVEMIFEALLPIPGQAAHWLLMRRRIADLCLKIPDRQKASKLYRELMAICEQQEMNRPRGGSSSR
jgi:hypothetical protein